MPGSEPMRLPMLTEVVPAAVPQPPAEAMQPDPLVESVLADVQRRVDVALEHRLRETLGPALARLSDALIQQLRGELASMLRDIVAEAVRHERRQGGRG